MQATEAAIQILNETVKIDQLAISQLINNRVICNIELANHPNVVVTSDNRIGMLGILNGILTKMGQPKIMVILGGNKILGFSEHGKPITLDFD